ncbi:MAG: DUF1254 domain-containing protein, partial [Oscillospiraceae bacterium]|nr:DUF1254 domain-containing protein [Oscillospiraceae bacterium]
MKKYFALLMTVIILLSSCLFSSCTIKKTGEDSKSTWELVGEAYTYALPLVIMDATKTSSTNTETPVTGRAPVNQLIHAQKLADAQSKLVVTPNVDTVYTQAWLDLSAEPMVYVMPKDDRFFNVQVLDAWTNTTAVLEKAGTYAFTPSGWKGDLPNGVIRVEVPTSMVWLIARVVLSGQEDLPNVYDIQQNMQLMPLSAYEKGSEYTAPKGTYTAENDFVPVEKVLSMSPKEFFDTANTLMLANPPAAADADVLKKFATINVGPGMAFDTSILTEDAAASWKEMLQRLREKLVADAEKYSVKLGQWKYFDAPIGDFGTEYNYRALVALAGLGANTVNV